MTTASQVDLSALRERPRDPLHFPTRPCLDEQEVDGDKEHLLLLQRLVNLKAQKRGVKCIKYCVKLVLLRVVV